MYNCEEIIPCLTNKFKKPAGVAQIRHIFSACERADAIARQADVVAALTLEVLKGTTNAFDSGEYIASVPELEV